jgi:hypothetical protein
VRRCGVEREVAESTKGDQLVVVTHRDGGSREGVSCDGLVKDMKRSREV